MDPARLEGIPLFADLDDEQRSQVASCVREKSVEQGTTLAAQGDFAYELFVIDEGEAEVRREGETIATLHAGDVFGEIGILMTGTRTASVVAATPMRLIVMFSRDFKRIERTLPAVAGTLRTTMRARVAQTPIPRSSH
jgi:CRP-like cAMP-binding protein